MPPVSVKVADGNALVSNTHISLCSWTYGDAEFQTRFRLLQLGHYDGILGLDWLAAMGPMGVDWGEKWLTINYKGQQVTFWGLPQQEISCSAVEMQSEEVPQLPVPAEVQRILDQFASVFVAPTGLPPRRRYDHHIPLLPGAQLILVRPYRFAPELKTEIEQQVAELLKQGVIQLATVLLLLMSS